jgi:hypothetical protein
MKLQNIEDKQNWCESNPEEKPGAGPESGKIGVGVPKCSCY